MFGKGPPSVRSGKDAPPPPTRRRFERAAVDLAAVYVVMGRAGEGSARIRNLSGGGVRLETEEDLPAGSVLALIFPLGEREIRAQGRVALSFFDSATSRYGHGLAFTAIDPAAQEAIAALVAPLPEG